jgi:hypothetical protein
MNAGKNKGRTGRGMKTRVEVRNEDGAWLPVAMCDQWGDAVLLATAATRHVRGARAYRAYRPHKSGGSDEYIGTMPEVAP